MVGKTQTKNIDCIHVFLQRNSLKTWKISSENIFEPQIAEVCVFSWRKEKSDHKEIHI